MKVQVVLYLLFPGWDETWLHCYSPLNRLLFHKLFLLIELVLSYYNRLLPRVCNRLFGLFGYSQKPIRLNSNLALLGKINFWICSIRNNRFVHLHSEVLRYSLSASTIRPLLEYLFMTISGYVLRYYIYDNNLKRNVNNVTVVTIYIYVETRLYVHVIRAVIRTSRRRTAPTTNHSSLSAFSNELVFCINLSELILLRSHALRPT